MADGKGTIDGAQLLEHLHEHADAGGTQERDLRQIHTNLMPALANHFSQPGAQMLRPIPIQPPGNAHLDGLAALNFRYLHGWLIVTPVSLGREKTSGPTSGPPCRSAQASWPPLPRSECDAGPRPAAHVPPVRRLHDRFDK